MSYVVRMARENCTCPVELLGHHQASQLVSQSHSPQREQAAAARALSACLLRPSIRRADGKDDTLCALVAVPSQPGSQSLRSHLPCARIEHQDNRLRAAPLPVQPVEQRLLASECFCSARRKLSAAFKIAVDKPVESVLCARPDVDVGERYLHDEENTANPGRVRPAEQSDFGGLGGSGFGKLD